MIPWFASGDSLGGPVPVTRLVHQVNAGRVYRDLDIHAPREAEGTYVRVRENNGTVEFSAADLELGRVPNVVGMTARDAVALLEALGLRTRLNGHGKVRLQSLRPGTEIEDQRTIELQLN